MTPDTLKHDDNGIPTQWPCDRCGAIVPLVNTCVIVEREDITILCDSCSGSITLPVADVAALVKLAWEQTRYIEETDRSATGSIYGIEYADKTIAKIAAKLPSK